MAYRPVRWLIESCFLALVALATCFAAVQQPQWPRDGDGHRYLTHRQHGEFSTMVRAFLIERLHASRDTAEHYCIVSEQVPFGSLIVSLTRADATDTPLCNDSAYTGGLVILPRPIVNMRPDVARYIWMKLYMVLQSRKDFLYLVSVDALVGGEPRALWIIESAAPDENSPQSNDRRS